MFYDVLNIFRFIFIERSMKKEGKTNDSIIYNTLKTDKNYESRLQGYKAIYEGER